jgi:hypothetical protein
MTKLEISMDVVTGKTSRNETPFTTEELAYSEQITMQSSIDNCKAKAKQLLSQTDWAVLPDVRLANSADFVTYRAIVRGLVINPVVDAVFPIEPTAVWS